MEEQYGERYAQKVEDRLLHYLHELDAVLQGDTYIDKVCVCFFSVVYRCVCKNEGLKLSRWLYSSVGQVT